VVEHRGGRWAAEVRWEQVDRAGTEVGVAERPVDGGVGCLVGHGGDHHGLARALEQLGQQRRTLVVGQGEMLGGEAGEHDRGDTEPERVLDHATERAEVERTGRGERGRQHGAHAGESHG
jgi:hypothetical protein